MVDPSKAVIIIPTYNEVENIEKLILEIFKFEPKIQILFIDDNSPDGSADLIRQLQQKYTNIHLLERPGKQGLGSAYIMGFRFALEKGYEYIFEMDADFSHNPREIPNFLKAIDKYDLVLGSRYIKGVNVVNWPLSRLQFLCTYSQNNLKATGIPVQDSTGGFKCFRRQVLESIGFDTIKSNGYAFQIEMNFKAWKKGFKVKEIPIIFVDRVFGESKLSKKIMWEAIFLVWKLRINSILGKV